MFRVERGSHWQNFVSGKEKKDRVIRSDFICDAIVVGNVVHYIKPGADEQELATPILSLCHGIFTD